MWLGLSITKSQGQLFAFHCMQFFYHFTLSYHPYQCLDITGQPENTIENLPIELALFLNDFLTHFSTFSSKEHE